MSDQTANDLIEFLERAIGEKKYVKEIYKLSVCWYGGEPLLRPSVIEKLSPRLIAFADAHTLEYGAHIITNGVNLDKSTWDLLQRERINDVQVTLDGHREAHNLSRPILPMYGENSNETNYDLIMDNIALKPKGITLLVRINTDKGVFDSLDMLLDDLEERGIWPQQAGKVIVNLAWKRPPRANSCVSYSTDGFFSKRQFAKVKSDFRRLLVARYNRWAMDHGRKNRASTELRLPEPAKSFLCGAASLPYSLTINPDGYIHQCWEHINDPSTRSHHLSDEYILSHEQKDKFVEWDKFSNRVCNKCKLFPVCNTTCPIEEPPGLCPEWKFRLRDQIREDYLSAGNTGGELVKHDPQYS